MRLLALKSNPPPNIRDWRRYAAKFLYNKASNRVRAWRATEAREFRMADPNQPRALWLWPKARDDTGELQMEMASAWNALTPDQRRLWEMLAEENGNQAKVARRLGKHRNTVRLWVQQIQRILQEHGFGPEDFSGRCAL